MLREDVCHRRGILEHPWESKHPRDRGPPFPRLHDLHVPVFLGRRSKSQLSPYCSPTWLKNATCTSDVDHAHRKRVGHVPAEQGPYTKVSELSKLRHVLPGGQCRSRRSVGGVGAR